MDNRYNANDAEELVEVILYKYSSPSGDETHCAKSDLKREFVRLIQGVLRDRDNVYEMHEAFMRAAKWNAEANKPLLQRLFNR